MILRAIFGPVLESVDRGKNALEFDRFRSQIVMFLVHFSDLARFFTNEKPVPVDLHQRAWTGVKMHLNLTDSTHKS